MDYTITNSTGQQLYAVDQLVMPAKSNKWTRSPRITVMNESAGVVKIALAAISSDRPSATLYTPTYRKIDAGASYQGTATAPWPLQAWNPVGGASPLKPNVESAVFMVQVFSGEPRSWKTLDSDDSEALVVPEGFTLQMLSVGPQPLPK